MRRAYFDTVACRQGWSRPMDDARLLLDVYVLQKGLYEIRYELSNRPDWVHWPLVRRRRDDPDVTVATTLHDADPHRREHSA
ncbi:MAG: hypothetical protein R2697_21575 [Ilumatobacteraceae bacterium]